MFHQRHPHDIPRQKRFISRWVLLGLILSVVIVSSLAFTRPVAQNRQAATAAVDSDPAMTETVEVSPTEEEEAPPTPEEIGYTNGIIFCATVLVLILLFGTLRSVIRNR